MKIKLLTVFLLLAFILSSCDRYNNHELQTTGDGTSITINDDTICSYETDNNTTTYVTTSDADDKGDIINRDKIPLPEFREDGILLPEFLDDEQKKLYIAGYSIYGIIHGNLDKINNLILSDNKIILDFSYSLVH